MDFLSFVLGKCLSFALRAFLFLLFFVPAVLLWEVAALIVMSGSLGGFLKSLGGPHPLLLMGMFFNGLYALPIVLYIAIAYAVSQLLNGWPRLLTFVGLCCVGSLGLIGFFMKFSTNLAHLREDGFVAFIVYPTLCVFALYLGRPLFQQPTRVRTSE
jgi:hypothetical protein